MNCQGCGQFFKRERWGQIYCSARCRRKAQNQRYYAKHQEKVRAKAREYYHKRKEML